MSISLLSEKLKSMYQSQGASEQQVQKPIEQANPGKQFKILRLLTTHF